MQQLQPRDSQQSDLIKLASCLFLKTMPAHALPWFAHQLSRHGLLPFRSYQGVLCAFLQRPPGHFTDGVIQQHRPSQGAPLVQDVVSGPEHIASLEQAVERMFSFEVPNMQFISDTYPSCAVPFLPAFASTQCAGMTAVSPSTKIMMGPPSAHRHQCATCEPGTHPHGAFADVRGHERFNHDGVCELPHVYDVLFADEDACPDGADANTARAVTLALFKVLNIACVKCALLDAIPTSPPRNGMFDALWFWCVAARSNAAGLTNAKRCLAWTKLDVCAVGTVRASSCWDRNSDVVAVWTKEFSTGPSLVPELRVIKPVRHSSAPSGHPASLALAWRWNVESLAFLVGVEVCSLTFGVGVSVSVEATGEDCARKTEVHSSEPLYPPWATSTAGVECIKSGWLNTRGASTVGDSLFVIAVKCRHVANVVIHTLRTALGERAWQDFRRRIVDVGKMCMPLLHDALALHNSAYPLRKDAAAVYATALGPLPMRSECIQEVLRFIALRRDLFMSPHAAACLHTLVHVDVFGKRSPSANSKEEPVSTLPVPDASCGRANADAVEPARTKARSKKKRKPQKQRRTEQESQTRAMLQNIKRVTLSATKEQWMSFVLCDKGPVQDQYADKWTLAPHCRDYVNAWKGWCVRCNESADVILSAERCNYDVFSLFQHVGCRVPWCATEVRPTSTCVRDHEAPGTPTSVSTCMCQLEWAHALLDCVKFDVVAGGREILARPSSLMTRGNVGFGNEHEHPVDDPSRSEGSGGLECVELDRAWCMAAENCKKHTKVALAGFTSAMRLTDEGREVLNMCDCMTNSIVSACADRLREISKPHQFHGANRTSDKRVRVQLFLDDYKAGKYDWGTRASARLDTPLSALGGSALEAPASDDPVGCIGCPEHACTAATAANTFTHFNAMMSVGRLITQSLPEAIPTHADDGASNERFGCATRSDAFAHTCVPDAMPA